MSNIVDLAFDYWWNQQTVRDSDPFPLTVWRAAVDAFSWKYTEADGMPTEEGNYMVVLRNNHILHAQYLRSDPSDPQSPKAWVAPVYGELDQHDEEPDFHNKGCNQIYYRLEDSRNGLRLIPIKFSDIYFDTKDDVCSFYSVDGPIKGCLTIMVNPPKNKHPQWAETARHHLNDMAMSLTRIVWWRRLELPGYEEKEET